LNFSAHFAGIKPKNPTYDMVPNLVQCPTVQSSHELLHLAFAGAQQSLPPQILIAIVVFSPELSLKQERMIAFGEAVHVVAPIVTIEAVAARSVAELPHEFLDLGVPIVE